MLVAATFPGTWNDAQSKILVPWFRNATKADATLTIQLATDQVAKFAASGGKPPFDVSIMDEGPLLDALKQDLLVKYPVDKSANFKLLSPMFQNEWGPSISVQVIGSATTRRRSRHRRSRGTISGTRCTRVAWD